MYRKPAKRLDRGPLISPLRSPIRRNQTLNSRVRSEVLFKIKHINNHIHLLIKAVSQFCKDVIILEMGLFVVDKHPVVYGG